MLSDDEFARVVRDALIDSHPGLRGLLDSDKADSRGLLRHLDGLAKTLVANYSPHAAVSTSETRCVALDSGRTAAG